MQQPIHEPDQIVQQACSASKAKAGNAELSPISLAAVPTSESRHVPGYPTCA
jgi:hypothetical protein